MEELYINHEDTDNLLGGNENGHYHLTREQLDWLIERMTEYYKPVIHADQVIVISAGQAIDGYKIESDRT